MIDIVAQAVTMEDELTSSKDFKVVGIDIYRI